MYKFAKKHACLRREKRHSWCWKVHVHDCWKDLMKSCMWKAWQTARHFKQAEKQHCSLSTGHSFVLIMHSWQNGWHPCWVTMVLNAITDRKAFCKQCDVLVMGVHRKKPDSSTVLQPCGILLPPCPAPLHSLILPSLAFSLLHQGTFYLILYARFFLLLISFSSSFTLLPPDISLPLYITQVSTKISPPQMIFLDHFCQRCWAVPQSHHAVPLSLPP